MGGARSGGFNMIKGLLNKCCNIIVVTAFPHYPHEKMPMKYKNKLIAPEQAGGAKVLCWGH